MQEGREISWRKRLLFVAAMTATAALALLGIGEKMMRARRPLDIRELTSPVQQPNPKQHWAHVHPYAAFVPRPGNDASAHKSVNNFGFVSTPAMQTVAKPAGRLRIAFFGGSSTAGTGTLLEDQDTWPFQTWRRLKEAYPGLDLEMINAAADGYTSFESYGRLWSQIRFFSPDIVVVYHGWNEMYYFDDASPERLVRRLYTGERDWGFPAVVGQPALAAAFLDRWLGWSQLYCATRVAHARRGRLPIGGGESGGPRKTDAELAADFDLRGVDVFRQNLLLMKGVCDLLGAEFYVMKQATLIAPDLPQAVRDERCFTWYHAFNYAAHLRAWAAIYEMIDRTFPAARVIDATPLSGRPDLLFDHIHPTPDGCRALAGLTADALRRHSAKLPRRP